MCFFHLPSQYGVQPLLFSAKKRYSFFWNPSTSQLIHNGVRLCLRKIFFIRASYFLQRFMVDFHKGNFKSEQLFFVYEQTLRPRLSADFSLVLYILVFKRVQIETLLD